MEPPATFQASYMAALTCAVIANAVQAFGGSKEDRKSFSPMDFLPDWAGDRPKKDADKQSIDEMKAAFRRLAGVGVREPKADKIPLPVPMKKRKAKRNGKPGQPLH